MRNFVNIKGNLTRDPETNTLPSGDRVTNFCVAVNGWKKDSPATFIECSAWGDLGDNIAKYFEKGKPIEVIGQIVVDEWADKNTGEKRRAYKVRVDNFEFVNSGPKPGGEGGEEAGGEPEAPQAGPAPKVRSKTKPKPNTDLEADDDIPF